MKARAGYYFRLAEEYPEHPTAARALEAAEQLQNILRNRGDL